MAYKGSVSRIEKLSRFVLVVVTLVLAGFLVALGDRILGDVDGWVAAPQREAFVDAAATEAAQGALSVIELQLAGYEESRAIYQKSLDKAERQYDAQKQSYDDWLQARATIGDSREDTEVRTRARALDRYRQIRESWQARIDEVEAQSAGLVKQRTDARKRLTELDEQAEERYGAAMRSYGIRLFLLRLALALPILVLAAWLFVRFRSARFWPMVWAWIVFSLYVFFVGLVPYMPSFGGYVRLVVGVVLSALAGYYTIRELGRYLEKKRRQLEASAKERAAAIPQETALQAFRSHCCPSCEKDFLIDKWYPAVRKAKEIRSTEEAPAHCSFCGLPLFGPCPACGKRNYLHFPHCSACGKGLATP